MKYYLISEGLMKELCEWMVATKVKGVDEGVKHLLSQQFIDVPSVEETKPEPTSEMVE